MPDILNVYGGASQSPPRTKLCFHPNQSSPLWGDVDGAMSIVALLDAYRVSYRVLPERLIQPYMLQNRNVLLFGRAEYSPAVRLLLADAPFVIEYNPEVRSWGVRNRSPKRRGTGLFSGTHGRKTTRGSLRVADRAVKRRAGRRQPKDRDLLRGHHGRRTKPRKSFSPRRIP